MSGSSDRAERGAVDDLWVVDVTAPLSGGRVHEVAADAAARLKLPVEKLLALLENRIGPVTKPLPHASAARVAEVLDLSGADVLLRPADPHDEPADVPEGPREASESPAASSDASNAVESGAGSATAEIPTETVPNASAPVEEMPLTSEPPAEPEPAAVPATLESATLEPATPEPARHGPATPEPATPEPATSTPPAPEAKADDVDSAAHASPDLAKAPSPPDADDPPIGRPGEPPRKHAPSPSGGSEAATRTSTSPGDPWGALDHDDDDAMLGGWRRAKVPSRSEPRPSRPQAAPGPTQAASAPTQAASTPTQAASAPTQPAPAATRSEPARPAASGAKEWRPIVERPPVRERHDDEDNSWSYGLRDPFAEADARERRLRRWVLMVALLIASTIFVALQWAYSRPGLGETGVASYQQGLAAYRDGAFVSAARAWTPRAESGDASAMFMLGWMAEFGQGRPWSNREAASWYRQASERGHAASQLRLADLYRRGLGVTQDPDVALQWYLRAAEAGVPRAQREAALLLARAGRIDEARAWLSQAAENDPDAAAWWSLAHPENGTTSLSR